MEAEFWQERWTSNKIGFHQQKINSRLKKYWPEIKVPAGGEVFVPLCGKSLDMLWLQQQGYSVVGIELSEKAVVAFFEENGLTFERQQLENLQAFIGTGEAKGIRLYCGDLFDLSADNVKNVCAFYDRAALVAMPPDLRTQYAGHLANILPSDTVGLLISMNYDASKMQGPPFSVDDAAVRALLSNRFNIQELSQSDGPEILGDLARRGLDTVEERVYRLAPTA